MARGSAGRGAGPRLTSPAALIAVLLLYPKSWKGSRGDSAGGDWIYRCPKDPKERPLNLPSKPRVIPVCQTHRTRLRLVSKPE